MSLIIRHEPSITRTETNSQVLEYFNKYILILEHIVLLRYLLVGFDKPWAKPRFLVILNTVFYIS